MNNKYFEWVYNTMCQTEDYTKLFETLHQMEFVYVNPYDANRLSDGLSLRNRYKYITNDNTVYEYNNPCSVLEMIAALAIRCEYIMDDPTKGDRTSQWFWVMIVSLGIGNMNNNNYDEDYIYECINIFLNHDYERDGKGGLFFVRGYTGDMRALEIWEQMCIYLNTIN